MTDAPHDPTHASQAGPSDTQRVKKQGPPSATAWHNRRVTVMGLGRFGGGVGVTRFLIEQGAHVLVTDQSPADTLAESVQALADLPQDRLTFVLGEHRQQDFETCDALVANPAVPPSNPFLQAAFAAGVPVHTEIGLLIERLPNAKHVVGITGSAGKSTTTAMVAEGLRAGLPDITSGELDTDAGCTHDANAHRPTVWVGGNFGGSLLADLPRIPPTDWVVLELSSFMLEHLGRDGWSPHIAAITNLAPNHLDWHGDLAAYRAAKQAILDHQSAERGDVALLTPQAQSHFTTPAPGTAPAPAGSGDLANETGFDVAKLVAAIPLSIPGEHNIANAELALRTCLACGVPVENIEATWAAIASFPGLPHRLCLVAEHNGVRFYDDSKSTTPEAAALALAAFPPQTCRLILGGYDKGADFTALAADAVRLAKSVHTLGKTGPAIAKAIETAIDQSGDGLPTTCGGVSWQPGPGLHRHDNLEQAMAKILELAQPGDHVLLSPGCASWDQYTDFQKRGHHFQSLTPGPRKAPGSPRK